MDPHAHDHQSHDHQSHDNMKRNQADFPVDLAEMVTWIRSTVPVGGRVLDVGCGDGSVVTELVANGIDATGVDPNAPTGRAFRQEQFEDHDAEPYDVIFASVSLHHLPEPTVTSATLARLSRPGTIALVREFDRDLLDHLPTLQWWLDTQRALDPETKLPATADEFRPTWRAQMDSHVLHWATVEKSLLDAGFDCKSFQPVPYLARWALGDEWRDSEIAAIAEGSIRQIGVRWTGIRTTQPM